MKTTTEKTRAARLGVPAQRSQGSRKGKRAWRKHIDIDDVEERLEERREEERVLGTAVHEQPDAGLFTIDTTGDENVRRAIPKAKRQLTSLAILNERSAVPAVVGMKRKPAPVSKAEKERLLRTAGRTKRGPLGSHVDGSEMGKGSALMELSEAVKESGKYDVWGNSVVDADMTEEEELPETIKPKPVKAPKLSTPREIINVPAVEAPHAGASYNPPLEAHQDLLLEAYKVEQQRIADEEKFADVKARLQAARENAPAYDPTSRPGMLVPPIVDDEEEEADNQDSIPRPAPTRKTKQQRAKQAKLKAEAQALAERAHRKRLLASVTGARALRRRQAWEARQRKEKIEERRRALAARLRLQGLRGQKLGKHKVPVPVPDVQLGEDLSGSLRAMKVRF
ncbi:P60-like protein [Schizophyllum commune Loenen D]|nr:P60-like protein [Schizophyllum commune Loenen D]